MIRSFGDTGTEDLFYRRDSRAARKSCPQDAWSAARRKLDYLHAARVLGDLVRLSADFKRLKGPIEGWCSLRVHDRYRVLFRWVNDAAEDVKVLDYH